MKPILFNTEMVRAILEDRKTVTRRVVKPQPCDGHGSVKFKQWFHRDWYTTLARFEDDVSAALCDRKPPYHPGNILWVRETWWKNYEHKYGTYFYRADGEEIDIPLITGGAKKKGKSDGLKWHPSIHMPKEAARLFLRVTGVRVERLRDMCLANVLMEGIQEADSYEGTWGRWHETWNSTIKPADLPLYGWEANPWVWVTEFERISKEAAIGGGQT